jgi:hypothetical protein
MAYSKGNFWNLLPHQVSQYWDSHDQAAQYTQHQAAQSWNFQQTAQYTRHQGYYRHSLPNPGYTQHSPANREYLSYEGNPKIPDDVQSKHHRDQYQEQSSKISDSKQTTKRYRPYKVDSALSAPRSAKAARRAPEPVAQQAPRPAQVDQKAQEALTILVDQEAQEALAVLAAQADQDSQADLDARAALAALDAYQLPAKQLVKQAAQEALPVLDTFQPLPALGTNENPITLKYSVHGVEKQWCPTDFWIRKAVRGCNNNPNYKKVICFHKKKCTNPDCQFATDEEDKLRAEAFSEEFTGREFRIAAMRK